MRKPKLREVMDLISIGRTAWEFRGNYMDKVNQKRRFAVEVQDPSYISNVLLEWMFEHSVQNGFMLVPDYDGLKRKFQIKSESFVMIEGYKLFVSREESKKADTEEDGLMFMQQNKNLFFTCDQRAGLNALERLMERLIQERRAQGFEHHLVTMRVRNGNPSWGFTALAKRTPDSVFLPGHVTEDVLLDFKNFLDSKEQYEKFYVPFHRGYLFYGEPGNGKTSMALALANEFKYNLYILPLGSIKDDAELASMIGEMEERSILLLEDVDVFTDSVSRDKGATGPTLSGLLNALDGVATPTGMVTIITTNNLDALDSALMRPGRVDYRLEFLPPTDEQVAYMFEYLYSEPLGVKPKTFASMAEASEIAKRNMFNAAQARKEMSIE